jgi:hypothetical protein
MMEVFDPASTRESLSSAGLGSSLYSLWSDETENNVSIVIPTMPQLLHAYSLPRERVYRDAAYQ